MLRVTYCMYSLSLWWFSDCLGGASIEDIASYIELGFSKTDLQQQINVSHTLKFLPVVIVRLFFVGHVVYFLFFEYYIGRGLFV